MDTRCPYHAGRKGWPTEGPPTPRHDRAGHLAAAKMVHPVQHLRNAHRAARLGIPRHASKGKGLQSRQNLGRDASDEGQRPSGLFKAVFETTMAVCRSYHESGGLNLGSLVCIDIIRNTEEYYGSPYVIHCQWWQVPCCCYLLLLPLSLPSPCSSSRLSALRF